MSVVVWLVTVQLALTLGWLSSRALARAGLHPQHQLWTQRALLVLAFALPGLLALAPEAPTPRVSAQVFDGPVAGQVTLSLAPAVSAPGPAITVPTRAVEGGGLLLLLVIGVGGIRFWRTARQLRARVTHSRPLGREAGVEVRVSDHDDAPFAARTPWRRVIVLDRASAADPPARALVLRHELQHHRQGDPAFAWAWLSLRALLGWNPAVGCWQRLAALTEELACDAAIVACPDVSPRAYGALLLAAATRPPALSGAVGLSPRSPLHRRLSMLARPPARRPRRAVLLATTAALCVASLTWGSRSLARDARGVPTADLATALSATPVIPDNNVVLEQLELMVAKHGEFYASSLDRQPRWAELVDGALEEAALPDFLAAVPLVESGYTNWGAPDSELSRSQAPGTIPGRGLWMFIAPTARSYGLVVTDELDERYDPEAETGAAMALLSDLYAEFGDWGLALAGYNMGARAVRRAIHEGETRDPWALTEQGLLNDYAASVMGAAVLMEHPELLD